jgi:hypothetical protein
MKTTNYKSVARALAKACDLYITSEGHIKLSTIDKDYFALSESEIVSRFDKWRDLIYYLKGYVAAKGVAGKVE